MITVVHQHNEVLLRQALRVYRNAIVEFTRTRLSKALGDAAPAELALLFGKVDQATGLTRWQVMRSAAERARVAPEVSTSVSDDFEVLGVADFYALFEKFFDQLFPADASRPNAMKAEIRAGVLRCARQVKVVRDPTSHEVTEDSGIDEVILTISNMVVLLKKCGCEAESAELRALLLGQLATKQQFTAALVRASGADPRFSETVARRLEAMSIKPVRLELDGSPPEDEQASQSEITPPSQTNLLVAMEAYPDPQSALAQSVAAAIRQGKKIVVVTPHSDPAWPTVAASLGLAPSTRVVFHPEYASEAARRIADRLVPEPTKALRAEGKPTIVPAAEAVLDDRLRVQLVSELTNINLKRVWLVSPFASDVGNLVLRSGQLSTLIAKQRARGVQVTFITRPPSAPEDPVEKRAFLDRLEREDVDVLLNSDLHAKIYLFDAMPAHVRWFVGSHNLTMAGLGRWREASMAGSRAVEYQQAHNAMVSLRDDPNTESYNIWKAREARRSWGQKQ